MNTETFDPRYRELDAWPTAVAVEAMLEGQLAAVAAVQPRIGDIARAADAAAARLGKTGRLVFAGAGTSGRLALQDGTELYPTFGWPMSRLVFLLAGGTNALTEAQEGAEDDGDAGRAEIIAADLGTSDVVIGVAASGRTPYTLAAIEQARAVGALTIGIANNADTPLMAQADHAIAAITGSEVLAGSTRMKAGTAQKIVLNLLSTAIMMRLGLVYEGRMVAMRISNAKLLQRGQRMVQDFAGVDLETATSALATANNDIRMAIVVARGVSLAEAQALFDQHDGNLRSILSSLSL